MLKYLVIGIDPGVKTGIAFWNTLNKRFDSLHTVMLHEGFRLVESHKASISHIVIEDPTLWTYHGQHYNAAKKLQGAGSIKRDLKAWVDFLTDLGVKFNRVRPDKKRNAISDNSTLFKQITNYGSRCSTHARDAAMLVVNS